MVAEKTGEEGRQESLEEEPPGKKRKPKKKKAKKSKAGSLPRVVVHVQLGLNLLSLLVGLSFLWESRNPDPRLWTEFNQQSSISPYMSRPIHGDAPESICLADAELSLVEVLDVLHAMEMRVDARISRLEAILEARFAELNKTLTFLRKHAAACPCCFASWTAS
ncbi:hypothetical protein BDK51DRAFT_31973 [Blyttiomyces helicus]|uniref:Uncharacterized protein n=1 Tax=Blyttiomyces helicus TaxID=388810 RepID=A0A4P9VYY1_9FUNG|nr:hypothetical protein BDK51DRAFT_31973 [Blyttiomyces helicus]|eukprot:RKO83006.1 hypothetical protein BDK51DRAFT_31973 [Blyttiomyces helicus]